MKKTAIIIVLIIILAIIFSINGFYRVAITDFESCVAAGNPVMESYPRQCRANGQTFVEDISSETPEEVFDYFNDKLIERAIELSRGAIPIEGFDPKMYLGLFSDLRVEDFNNVEAIGGIWKFSNGDLKFTSTNSGVATSADGTVNRQGMEDLLENLKKRLLIRVETFSDVETLIELLSQNSVKYFCPEESRNVGACITLYNPVCGWNDPEKIQCIKFPCASTYSNSCEACKNPDVLYYTNEECPIK